MNKIDTKPLYYFLEKESKYLTSLGFFIILLTLTLFITKSESYDFNIILSLFQASAFILSILCFLPLEAKLRDNKDFLLQVFYLLIIILLGGFIGILWFEYRGVVKAFFVITMIIAGVFHIGQIYGIFFFIKLKRKLIEHWISIFGFFIIISVQLVLFFRGESITQFSNIIEIPKTFSELILEFGKYMFVGYVLFIVLILITKLPSLIFNNFRNTFSCETPPTVHANFTKSLNK